MKLPVKSDLEKRDLAPVSQKSQNCSGATIPFTSLQGQGSKPSTWFFLRQKYVKRSAFQNRWIAV